MDKATMVGFDRSSKVFSYKLSRSYVQSGVIKGFNTAHKIIKLYSRPDYTKASASLEITKTLGVKSHKCVLDSIGYEMVVPIEFVVELTDGDLWAAIEELDKTGDDYSIFWRELERRVEHWK